MAYLIRSDDGRTTICTASAKAAVDHAMRLKRLGLRVRIVDFNGEPWAIASLRARASAGRSPAELLRAA